MVISSSLMREMGVPSMTISPAVGRSRPPIRWSSVLFPEPLGPMIDTNSPAAMSRVTPASARTSASPWRNTLCTSRTEIIASSPGAPEPLDVSSALGNSTGAARAVAPISVNSRCASHSSRWRVPPRSLPELLQQRLRLAQVARVEALGEPAVDRGEQVARLRRAALGPEPAAKARGRAQLGCLRPLAPGEVHRLPVARLHRGGLRALPGQQIAAEAKERGLHHLLGRRAEGVLHRPQRVGEGAELRLPLSQQPQVGSDAEAMPRCRVRGPSFAELRDALLAVPLLRQGPSAVEGAVRNVVRELLLGGELDERLRDLPRPIGFAEGDVEGGHHHLGECQVKRLLQALRE